MSQLFKATLNVEHRTHLHIHASTHSVGGKELQYFSRTGVKSLDELEDALYNAKLAWIEFALDEKGWEIPKPMEEDDFSGKFLVRCPKAIHKP